MSEVPGQQKAVPATVADLGGRRQAKAGISSMARQSAGGGVPAAAVAKVARPTATPAIVRPAAPGSPTTAKLVTGPTQGAAARKDAEAVAPPAVKGPKGPKVEGPEGEATNSAYGADEGDVMHADAVDEGKVAALGGAVEGRGGILGSAENDADGFRQQAAEEQCAQDELAAKLPLQRKANRPTGPPGGGAGPVPVAPVAGPAATAEDDAAIRAQAGAEFSGFSAGAKEWSPKGGGGGGSPVVPKPPPPIPNVAGREPASALSALAGLPPAQILGAMGGVAAAASTAVGKKEKALAASPPTKRIAEGPAGPGAPPVKPSLDTKVEEIKPSGGKEPEAKAGEEHIEAPPIMLSGETDPANVTAQEAAGKVAATSASSAAKSGLAAPRGEERLNPKVKAQTVKPEVPVGSGRVDVASEPAAEDASMVAFQEKPGELHSAVAKGSGEVTKASSEASKQEAEHQKSSDAEINKAEAEHAKQLKEEQAKGRGAVDKERKEADAQHAKLLSSHSTEASAKKAEAITHVNTEKVKGDAEAKRHVGEANTKIAAEKHKGQEQARKAELEERKKDSGGGIWGAIKRAASAVVDAVKSAVKAVMDAVKSAVKSIVSTVVSAVGSVLKGVWNAITSVVKAAIDVLKKLASAFLDALKALIDAALALIDSIIKAALAALQALAALLPGILGKLLSALVSVLKAVYDGLKAAYKAAIEAVKSAVAAVVSWAKAAIEALGMLAGLVKDIASAPGRWFSNLLSSVKDGIMVHLFWAPLSTAIKKWWDDKVKGLIGAPKAVLDMLVKGGITFKEVLEMAWDAIKSALPEIVIQQLIEKVVSALNVGAGTALLLLRTLQAAWASIGAIIGAIQKFFGFLKAVKGGSAGGQFAEAVAAGAVAVIEFVSNFLMARLGSKLKPFKDKLGGLAKKIGEKLLGATKKAGSKIVAAGKAALDKVRKSKLGQMVKTGADKAGDLKKKYDKWKYGDAEGKSKWASAEAAEDAAWSEKVHEKTGGRFGEASTSSTPHHTTGGDHDETSSTATHPDAEGSGTGTTQHPDHGTKAKQTSEDGANEIKVKESGVITACQRIEEKCSIVGHKSNGESDDDAAKRLAATTGGDAPANWAVPAEASAKLPPEWASKPNKKDVGIRWQDPKNPGNGVRIDQGNPAHSLPAQQVDHVVVRSGGKVLGRDGRPISGSIKEDPINAHIPLSEYLTWKSWNAP